MEVECQQRFQTSGMDQEYPSFQCFSPEPQYLDEQKEHKETHVNVELKEDIIYKTSDSTALQFISVGQDQTYVTFQFGSNNEPDQAPSKELIQRTGSKDQGKQTTPIKRRFESPKQHIGKFRKGINSSRSYNLYSSSPTQIKSKTDLPKFLSNSESLSLLSEYSPIKRSQSPSPNRQLCLTPVQSSGRRYNRRQKALLFATSFGSESHLQQLDTSQVQTNASFCSPPVTKSPHSIRNPHVDGAVQTIEQPQQVRRSLATLKRSSQKVQISTERESSRFIRPLHSQSGSLHQQKTPKSCELTRRSYKPIDLLSYKADNDEEVKSEISESVKNSYRSPSRVSIDELSLSTTASSIGCQTNSSLSSSSSSSGSFSIRGIQNQKTGFASAKLPINLPTTLSRFGKRANLLNRLCKSNLNLNASYNLGQQVNASCSPKTLNKTVGGFSGGALPERVNNITSVCSPKYLSNYNLKASLQQLKKERTLQRMNTKKSVIYTNLRDQLKDQNQSEITNFENTPASLRREMPSGPNTFPNQDIAPSKMSTKLQKSELIPGRRSATILQRHRSMSLPSLLPHDCTTSQHRVGVHKNKIKSRYRNEFNQTLPNRRSKHEGRNILATSGSLQSRRKFESNGSVSELLDESIRSSFRITSSSYFKSNKELGDILKRSSLNSNASSFTSSKWEKASIGLYSQQSTTDSSSSSSSIIVAKRHHHHRSHTSSLNSSTRSDSGRGFSPSADSFRSCSSNTSLLSDDVTNTQDRLNPTEGVKNDRLLLTEEDERIKVCESVYIVPDEVEWSDDDGDGNNNPDGLSSTELVRDFQKIDLTATSRSETASSSLIKACSKSSSNISHLGLHTCNERSDTVSKNDESQSSISASSQAAADGDSYTKGEGCMRKAFHVASELVTTERAYVQVLYLISEVFYERICSLNKSQPVFPSNSVIIRMFSNIKSIYRFHNNFFLPQLEDRISKWNLSSDHQHISDVIVRFSPFFKMYTEYVKNFDIAVKTIDFWYGKSSKFANLVDSIQSLPECRMLSLQHHMLSPVQRIPRYVMLVRDYMNALPQSSIDIQDAKRALQLVSIAASHANEAMKRIESFQRQTQIQNLLGLEKSSRDSTSNRAFLKEGRMWKLKEKDNSHQIRYLYLFSDMLIICSSNSPPCLQDSPPPPLYSTCDSSSNSLSEIQSKYFPSDAVFNSSSTMMRRRRRNQDLQCRNRKASFSLTVDSMIGGSGTELRFMGNCPASVSSSTSNTVFSYSHEEMMENRIVYPSTNSFNRIKMKFDVHSCLNMTIVDHVNTSLITPNTFYLSDGINKSILLYAKSRKEKQDWISSIRQMASNIVVDQTTRQKHSHQPKRKGSSLSLQDSNTLLTKKREVKSSSSVRDIHVVVSEHIYPDLTSTLLSSDKNETRDCDSNLSKNEDVISHSLSETIILKGVLRLRPTVGFSSHLSRSVNRFCTLTSTKDDSLYDDDVKLQYYFSTYNLSPSHKDGCNTQISLRNCVTRINLTELTSVQCSMMNSTSEESQTLPNAFNSQISSLKKGSSNSMVSTFSKDSKVNTNQTSCIKLTLTDQNVAKKLFMKVDGSSNIGASTSKFGSSLRPSSLSGSVSVSKSFILVAPSIPETNRWFENMLFVSDSLHRRSGS